jgi:RNA polymerase sigma-70 factor (ECF subfamily)
MYISEPVDENQWITALKKGDEKVFEQIYNHYWQKLYSVAYNYTRCRQTAQEVVQEVFVNLWVHRQERTLHKCLQAYLYGAIRNKIYDYFDKQTVRERFQNYALRQYPAASNTTEQQLIFDELQEIVTRQIDGLPETTKKVFTLSRMQGFSIPEIALEMKLSVKTVEYHLTKALKHLRLHLTELLVVCMMLLAE